MTHKVQLNLLKPATKIVSNELSVTRKEQHTLVLDPLSPKLKTMMPLSVSNQGLLPSSKCIGQASPEIIIWNMEEQFCSHFLKLTFSFIFRHFNGHCCTFCIVTGPHILVEIAEGSNC